MAPNRFDRTSLWFVQEADHQTTPSQLYHENSKVGAYAARFTPTAADERAMEEFQKTVAGRYKRYDYAPKHPLPKPDPGVPRAALADVILQRRSRRELLRAPVELTALSTLLTLGAGLNGESHFSDGQPLPLRTYPSAGALYPLELYPILLDTPGIARGVYHHDPHQSVLDQLTVLESRDVLKPLFQNEPMLESAGALLVISAVLPRLRRKYGERAYRYAHLEAGHAAQNLVLLGTALGLSVVPVGGFVERGIEELIDADGVEEIALYSLFIGHPAPRATP